MKAKDLIAALQKFDGEIEVLVLAGNNCHPISACYKDDAPFSNMNCVFVQADFCVLAMRPPKLETENAELRKVLDVAEGALKKWQSPYSLELTTAGDALAKIAEVKKGGA